MDRLKEVRHTSKNKGRVLLAALGMLSLSIACTPNANLTDQQLSNFCVSKIEDRFKQAWPLVTTIPVKDIQPGVDDFPNRNIALIYESGKDNFINYNSDVDERGS